MSAFRSVFGSKLEFAPGIYKLFTTGKSHAPAHIKYTAVAESSQSAESFQYELENGLISEIELASFAIMLVGASVAFRFINTSAEGYELR